MQEFLQFDLLITPYIIEFVYIFGALVVPFLFYAYFKKFKLKISNQKFRLYLLIAFIMLEIMWRMFCEFFIVYFKIFLSLQ